MCGAVRVAEAPSEVADRRVFVISHRGSLWGLHREEKAADGASRSQVVAFEVRGDAERLAERLWIHRLKAHRWPDTVLEGRPLWLASGTDIVLHAPNPLKVDEIDLRWLLDRMGKSRAAVSLVFPLDPDADEINLKGKYMEARVPPAEQVAWLDKMLKRNANPNRD